MPMGETTTASPPPRATRRNTAQHFQESSCCCAPPAAACLFARSLHPRPSPGTFLGPNGTHQGPLFYAFLAPPAPQPQSASLLPCVARRHRRALISDPCVSVCIGGSILFVTDLEITKRTQSPLRASVSPCFHSRSEEHTSELQSQSNLVCCLLLE